MDSTSLAISSFHVRPEILSILQQENVPQKLQDFKQRLHQLVMMSRRTMTQYYPMWDKNDQVYRGERVWDDVDRKAERRNEPAKVYVPLTHSQIQTFVSFARMMLTQRDYFYELGGTGAEDAQPAELGQAVLQRDLEYNKFTGVLLPQFLTDLCRYGVGVLKSHWVRETVPVAQQVPDPSWRPVPNLPGAQQQPPTITQYVPTTSYLGNRLAVISPYRWFPDTRLPITRADYGEFQADEIEYSRTELETMERDGTCAGVEFCPSIPNNAYSDRRSFLLDQQTTNGGDPMISPEDARKYVLITEVEIKLNPSRVEIDDGVFLDPQLDAEVVYLVWIANDSRIVRIEDSGYSHNKFLYDSSQFFNDQNRMINFGIAELLAPMQAIVDWLLNSRVTNVRKVIQNQLIVDPRYIDMNDLKERNPVIRIKGISDLPIDQMIKQLQVTDVTTGHLTDMALIKDFSQDATGLSENLVGQYSSGRRSARESSNVNANAAARVVLPIVGIWQSALLPLGRKMLKNLQSGLDTQQLVNVVGLSNVIAPPPPTLPGQPPAPPQLSPAVAAFLPVDKTSLEGSYDFLIFDDTLPSQRMAIAGNIQEILVALSQSPELVFALGYDPKLLLEEWFKLVGIRNADRFKLTPQRFGELAQLAGAARNAGGAKTATGQGSIEQGNGPSRPA